MKILAYTIYYVGLIVKYITFSITSILTFFIFVMYGYALYHTPVVFTILFWIFIFCLLLSVLCLCFEWSKEFLDK